MGKLLQQGKTELNWVGAGGGLRAAARGWGRAADMETP